MTRIILDFKFLKYPLCLDPPFGQKGAACNRIVNLHRASALSASRGNGLSGLHLKAICSAADVCDSVFTSSRLRRDAAQVNGASFMLPKKPETVE